MKIKKKTALISVGALLILWQGMSMQIDYSFVLPSPYEVFCAMLALPFKQLFYTAVGATLLRSLIGLLAAFLLAGLLAAASWKQEWLRELFAPILLLMRSIPNISVIVLILYWCPRSISSILISFFILFPMIYQALFEALKEIDRTYLNVLRVYPKRRWDAVGRVYLPLLRPAISAASCSGISLSLKVGVMAEILGQVSQGIGRQMQLARVNLDLVAVLAWTGWIIILLFVFDRLLQRLVRVLCRGI